ncbi:fumarylacetoacetate hydrolase family protein (plasmid) [Rhizobium bangladeshense]|uniref:fumarylacetoacetate hydrolase family protein n=1 Tax=Rhizobium bangladeshense TaxID=1138189 RepID=UPI001A9A221A|nr:fumarylacetoacetate hydrolase family protein [Rhizobium bangladeshense]QSY97888.1 fumarylacetoacetate hydrolase family protein [Rhizobium bangladeshense]
MSAVESTRIVTYRADRGERAGLLVGDKVYDAANLTGDQRDVSVMSILGNWDDASARLTDAVRSRLSNSHEPVSDAELLAPLTSPGTIYCAGANYADHAAEMARANGTQIRPKSDRSWHFLKSSRAVVGPGSTVELPRNSSKIDWEVELAAVIGRKCKDVGLEHALDYVAGYSVAIDLSARDLSRRLDVAEGSPFKMDWMSHKNFDGSCPLGPFIVPANEVGDPQDLGIELSVNGELKQKSTTAEMIFSLAEQIRDLSRQITLWPGDIILTGTPAGVGTSRGEFLKAGDVVAARIDGLGELRTTMG